MLSNTCVKQNNFHHSTWVMITKTALAGALFALILSGCGGGGEDKKEIPANNTPTGTYTVNVADDAIVGARVSAPECAKFTENGNGTYTLEECISKPSTITAVGGSFDMDGTTVYQAAPLILKTSQLGNNTNFVVTPLTTLASQEENLSELALALDIPLEDLFLDKQEHRSKMREINTVLNTARNAGITKYEAFVTEFKKLIKTQSGISAAKQHMIDNLATYRTTFGVVFGGFISDMISNPEPVASGRVRLGGFVYDATIPNAQITIYDGIRSIATGTSDENGRYSIEIEATELATSKVLRFVAVSGNTKLIAYITTNELKSGEFGRRVSSGTVEDLIISNVTTAKAVLVDRVDPSAESNATSMVETKLIVESMYAIDILNIASSIKAVVDYNADMNQSDTLALAQAIAAGEQPTNTNYTGNVLNDPILSDQLNSTTPDTTYNFKSLMIGKTFIDFDYHSEYSNNSSNPFTYFEFKINSDGSVIDKEYRNTNGSTWSLEESRTQPAGTIQWSSDGTIAYDSSDNWVPSKHTLIRVETISFEGASATVYWMRDEVTAEPTDGYYTNFKTTAENTGTYNSATHTITMHGDTINLNDSYISTVTKFGQTYYIANWDNGREMYYVEGTHAYSKDYDVIGSVEVNWVTDSAAVRTAYKNATQNSGWITIESDVSASLPMNWGWSEIKRAIYDFMFGA